MRPTKRQLDYFIEDEKKAVKEYAKAGLPKLAGEEARHLKYLKKLRRG
jgi:hypothetical protein